MKRILFILVSLFVLTAVSNEIKAQVGFANQQTGVCCYTAQVYCTQPVTVKFEVKMYASSSGYGSVSFVINGQYLSGSAPAGQTTSRFYTITLPAGYTNVRVSASKGTGVLLLNEVNGQPSSTSPLMGMGS